jgi:CHAT domain-containing protein/tetratricopeptide (TPR) repeat protein
MLALLTAALESSAQEAAPAKLLIINESGSEVLIYWFNNGKAVYYQKVSANQRCALSTDVGHRWRAVIAGTSEAPEFVVPAGETTWSVRETRDLTEPQKEKLKERDRYSKEAGDLEKAAKLREAIAVGDKMLAIDREVFGDAHRHVVASLTRLARWHEWLGDFAAAEQRRQEIVQLQTKLWGATAWQVADARLDLQHVQTLSKLDAKTRQELFQAVTWMNQAMLSKTKFLDGAELAEKALSVRLRILGDGHPLTAAAANWAGFSWHLAGDDKKAERLYRQALEIRKKAFGEAHPDYVFSLNTLGNLYRNLGDYEKSEPLLRQALEISKTALGAAHPHQALTLDNLAMWYWSQGDYVQAESLRQQALASRKKGLGEAHPDYAQSLANLAQFYRNRGDLVKAETLYRQALESRKKAVGDTHYLYISNLENLAATCQTLGDCAKAEPLYIQVLELGKIATGEEHLNYAAGLSSLAGLYWAQGDFVRAEPLFLRAQEIYKKVLGGDDNLAYATGLSNLAQIYEHQGDYAKAEPLHLRALEITRKRLGEGTHFAARLNQLALMYTRQGLHEKAEPLLVSALAINKRALGETHPDYSTSLNNLACIYQRLRDYEKAAPLFQQALAVSKKTLGETHPTHARNLHNLALLVHDQGNVEQAEPLLRQAVLVRRQHLEFTSLHQSERQQIADRAAAEIFLNNLLVVTAKLPASTSSTYDALLSWKGSVTARQQLARISRTAMAADPEAKRLFGELEILSREIKLWSLTDADKLPRGVDRPKKLAELSEQREQIEASLSQRTEAFRMLRASQKLTSAVLQKLLPEGTVLVDFVIYNGQLAAFVVTRNKLQRVELKEIKPLAEAVQEFRASLKRGQPLKGKNDPARVLREKLLDPLDEHLTGAKLILIAPDGPLNQLPFAALPGRKQGSYLLEEVALAMVPVPQMLPELLAPASGAKDSPPSLLVLGDVDFDAVPAKSDKPVADPGILALGGERSGRNFQWKRLPGTAAEMEMIEKMFRMTSPKGVVTSLRAAQATEEIVRKKAPEHDYLHLATHGFFAPREFKKLRFEVGVLGLEQGNERSIGHHPGLLSGLVLAGANRAGEGSGGDGVLTALEVGDLDLTHVQVAVLSACETGLGETAGGEGVLGLQRAFQVAGARTVFATLWSIPDEATQVLMARFYDNLWSKKMGRLEALREAQLWMLREGRTHPGVQRGVARDEEPNAAQDGRLPPYYWAAFVLSGDWR